MAGTTLYGIANCDTVKRARAWLAGQGVDFEFHDFKKAGVPAADLDRWLDAAGWERLLNRNRIFVDRTKGVGLLTREDAINRSASGPVARASGVPRDLRKERGYRKSRQGYQLRSAT